MTERERKRNTRTLKARESFQISRKPVVRLAADGRPKDAGNGIGLPRAYGPSILFAIARDSCCIFTCWNIDWLSVFKKAMPVDRQVYLRVYRADGLEEKRILWRLEVSLPEIAAARRTFDDTDSEKLARRTGALLGFSASSPSRGFADTSWS